VQTQNMGTEKNVLFYFLVVTLLISIVLSTFAIVGWSSITLPPNRLPFLLMYDDRAVVIRVLSF